MAAAVAIQSSSGGGGLDRHMDSSGKYVRYTAEQVEALERVYTECPKPSSMRRQQLISECPILSNIEPKQIKVWFQNRRCREKQRKESSRLQAVNRKLTAMNKLLMEENERLQKQVAQLVHENAYMRQQLQTASLANDTSCESVVTAPQIPLRDANNPAGLLSIAEETLAEFLSKATGTAVDWVQMPGMKPGPDSIGIVAISRTCSGVAARACGLVSLEPTKIAEILKDRSSWFRDCRSLEIFTMFPAGNGGTIELVYMQMYAPTTLAPARDFWTLRYTTSLEDGSTAISTISRPLGHQPYLVWTRYFSSRYRRDGNEMGRECVYPGDGSLLFRLIDAIGALVAFEDRKFSKMTCGGGIIGYSSEIATYSRNSASVRGFPRTVRDKYSDLDDIKYDTEIIPKDNEYVEDDFGFTLSPPPTDASAQEGNIVDEFDELF